MTLAFNIYQTFLKYILIFIYDCFFIFKISLHICSRRHNFFFNIFKYLFGSFFKYSCIPHREAFPPCFAKKNHQKKSSLFGSFRPFQAIISNRRPLFSINFPQGFWISKKFVDCTSGSGCKKTFKRYLKKWTHGHTDRQINL